MSAKQTPGASWICDPAVCGNIAGGRGGAFFVQTEFSGGEVRKWHQGVGVWEESRVEAQASRAGREDIASFADDCLFA